MHACIRKMRHVYGESSNDFDERFTIFCGEDIKSHAKCMRVGRSGTYSHYACAQSVTLEQVQVFGGI